MKKLDRRQFIKLASAAGGGFLMPDPLKVLNDAVGQLVGTKEKPASEYYPEPVAGARFGMVIDLGKCIGCRRCAYACKLENNVPDTISPPYIMVFETEAPTGAIGGHYASPEMRGRGTTMFYTKLRKDKWYMPVQCNHCDNAPCVEVCPTGASYKDPDGLVLIDYDKCIGCRYCMTACPYGARRFNWWEPHVARDRRNPLVPMRRHGVVEKCTFCVHRTRKGKFTRCVEVCPNKARTFGNLNDPDSKVSKLIESERNFRLKIGLNTGPRIWYLTKPREKRMRWYRPLPPFENLRGIRS
ncbi:MAG TPA: 4Fe-4S dicluster domain-containing protein [Nitrospirae bacterium]|nr:4Fe-4S dicluster domain-containing protein [Nitrospirota bacterium]HDL19781.1 4Fe-4S dicluster domain-containing protein [Nitrospirota bacterium]HDZ02050.1 4Fe-4S dicluster domain-containing protein [Nitrospirota bacterium]